MKTIQLFKKAIFATALFLTLLPVSVSAAHSNDVIDMSLLNFSVNIPGGTYKWSYYAPAQRIEVISNVTVIGAKTDADQRLTINIPAGVTVTWKAGYVSTEEISLVGSGTFDVAAGGTISSSGNYAIRLAAVSGLTVKVTGGIVENGTTSTIGVSSSSTNANVIITGGEVKSTGRAIFYQAANTGIAVYLAGTVTAGYQPPWGPVLEVDVLEVPVSRNGTSTGITIMAGDGTAVWDTGGPVPVIVFTPTSGTPYAVEWGSYPAPPVLSAGSAIRTGETAATANFTTSGAGTAYYVVSAAAAAPPASSAAVKATGASLGAVPAGTVSKAVSILPEASNIYVVVENENGLSNMLKIEAGDFVPIVNIQEIAGIKPPVAGIVPVTAITETAQYTGTVSWSPADAKFQNSTAYTATITLTPKGSYVLSGVAEDFFTVAGASTVANAANSGEITAVFPATAAYTPLVFSEDKYAVPPGLNGTFGSVDISDAVSGGTPPYTYEVVSMADGSTWLYTSVSVMPPYPVTVQGMRPIGQRLPTTALIKVTDAMDAFITFTVEVGMVMNVHRDLDFANYGGIFNVPPGGLGSAISPIDVSGGVTPYSGIAPYKFTKESGPDWLYIDEYTGIVTGMRPWEAQAETEMIIRATSFGYTPADAAHSKTITLVVGEVTEVIDLTPPTLSAGSAIRINDEAATIAFTTDEAGIARYLVLENGAPAPTSTEVSEDGILIGDVPVGATGGKAVTLTEGAKDVYVVVADYWLNISEPLKIAVSAATGIVETWRAASQPVGYYSILGQKLPQEPEKGIYIILYDNGKAVKVIK